MNKEARNWLDSAKYDLEVAGDMLKAGRYPYVVFFCHLAVEKALKAKVQEATGKAPPKTHDLITLLKLAELVPPVQLLEFIGKLSGASTATRYPLDLAELISTYTREAAEGYLQQAEEVVKWIAEHLKL